MIFLKNLNIIQNLLLRNKGIITAKDISKNNIARQYIKNMIDKGELEKVSRGVYLDPNVIEDEYFTLQSRYSKVIFCNETALFLHGMSDRIPLIFDVTLPNGYNISKIKKSNILNIYRSNKKIHELGLTVVLSPHGKKLRVYNIEKTICDIIKNENKVDKQVFIDAIRLYARKKDKDLSLLNEYSKILKVEKLVKIYLEMLL